MIPEMSNIERPTLNVKIRSVFDIGRSMFGVHLLHPQVPIQTPVLYRLRNVLGKDVDGLGEVGDGSGYFEDTIVEYRDICVTDTRIM